MLRSLIAVIIAISIAFTGIINPAYAEDHITNYNFNNSQIEIHIDSNNTSSSINKSDNGNSIKDNQDSSNSFMDSLGDGVVGTLAFTIGGAIVCYSLDTIAAAFFPPASTLAAFCPAIVRF
ncbi:MAG: hypothetical protein RLZZ507_2424 [Cyanobacteriota bacterium]|jgi:hypothetical protein